MNASNLNLVTYSILVIIACLAGIWICGQASKELRVHDHPGIVWDEFAGNPGEYPYMYWHPDGDEFRKTDVSKTVMRESGVLAYWQARGFPPQCRPVGEDDFECTFPDTRRRSSRTLVN